MRAAWTVFRKSIAIVIGPTPPGTGVIRSDLGGAWKVDVTAQAAVVAPVNADVDHDRARLDPIGGDPFRLAHGDDQQVGLAAQCGRVAGRGVAHCHCRVSPLALLQEEQGHGFAHDLRPAQDDRVHSAGFDAAVGEELADAQRRARNKSRCSPASKPRLKG